MRIQITAGGIFGADGKEVPIGAEFDFNDEPTGWAGRYIVVSESKGKIAARGEKKPEDPAKAELEAMDVDALKKLADDLRVDLKGASAKGDMIDALLKASAKA